MRLFAANVIRFNEEILKIPKRRHGLMGDQEHLHLRKSLNEEITEFEEAYEKGDFIGCIDALVDICYFAVGGLYKMGLSEVEIEKCGKLVHLANMMKARGEIARRATGAPDAVKPKGWKGPEEDMKAVLGWKM